MELKLPVDFGRTAISQTSGGRTGGIEETRKEGSGKEVCFLLILLLTYNVSSPRSEVSKKICLRCWKLQMRLSENVILLFLLFLHLSPISCLFLPTDAFPRLPFCVGGESWLWGKTTGKERNNHTENYCLFPRSWVVHLINNASASWQVWQGTIMRWEVMESSLAGKVVPDLQIHLIITELPINGTVVL